jgi:hypothetical protein
MIEARGLVKQYRSRRAAPGGSTWRKVPSGAW